MHRQSDENFLTRWSRRKREANQDAVQEKPAGQDAPVPDATADREPTDADMPSVESLDTDSDYSPFFSPKVSEELRRVALRKLFKSAVFNVRDGLDDYDEDFRSFASLGDIITADMRHQMERQAEARQAELDAETAGLARQSDAKPAEDDEAVMPPPDTALSEAPSDVDPSTPDDDDPLDNPRSAGDADGDIG